MAMVAATDSAAVEFLRRSTRTAEEMGGKCGERRLADAKLDRYPVTWPFLEEPAAAGSNSNNKLALRLRSFHDEELLMAIGRTR